MKISETGFEIICQINLLEVDVKKEFYGIEYGHVERQTLDSLCTHFCNGIRAGIAQEDKFLMELASIMITVSENLKLEYPKLAFSIRKQIIEFKKQENG